MTLRFRRATKLRAMMRGIEKSHDMLPAERQDAIDALEMAIAALDPPKCAAWGNAGRCRNRAPNGSLYCSLHRNDMGGSR